MSQTITDAQFAQLLEDGYLILPGFIPAAELPELQAAQRRVLKTWEQVRDNPPADRSMLVPYPYGELLMDRLYLHPELIRVGKRYLKSEQVHVGVGYMLARYPGFVSHDKGHIDNGNNSLLPMSESLREYGQIQFWIHLEETREDQAPLQLVRNRDRGDLAKAEKLVCPPGTVNIFTNYTFHASSTFTGKQGQRFTWGFLLKRADHPWEGLIHYTSLGQHPAFKKVISSLTAEQRCLFRFPPPNHPYYTKQTLAALETQYPGWNARGEYRAMD